MRDYVVVIKWYDTMGMHRDFEFLDYEEDAQDYADRAKKFYEDRALNYEVRIYEGTNL